MKKISKKKNNNKIIYVVVLLLVICIGILFFKLFLTGEKDIDMGTNSFYDKYNAGERFALVLYREKCYRCDEYLKHVSKIAKKRKIEIYYLNTDKFDSVDSKIYKLCGAQGTPALVIMDDKKSVDVLKGYNSYNQINKFLKKNKF